MDEANIYEEQQKHKRAAELAKEIKCVNCGSGKDVPLTRYCGNIFCRNCYENITRGHPKQGHPKHDARYDFVAINKTRESEKLEALTDDIQLQDDVVGVLLEMIQAWQKMNPILGGGEVNRFADRIIERVRREPIVISDSAGISVIFRQEECDHEWANEILLTNPPQRRCKKCDMHEFIGALNAEQFKEMFFKKKEKPEVMNETEQQIFEIINGPALLKTDTLVQTIREIIKIAQQPTISEPMAKQDTSIRCDSCGDAVGLPSGKALCVSCYETYLERNSELNEHDEREALTHGRCNCGKVANNTVGSDEFDGFGVPFCDSCWLELRKKSEQVNDGNHFD